MVLKIIAILSLLLSGPGAAGHAPQVAEPLMATYSKQVEKELIKWSASYSGTQHLRSDEGREFYRILDKAGKPSGILVLTSAPGRFDRFDLMVVIDPAGRINLIRILKYRSDYGSEITGKSWLSQFYTPPGKPFELHKNIDAISGATYSSRGITNEINAVIAASRGL